MRSVLLIIASVLCFIFSTQGQDSLSLVDKITEFPSKFLDGINSKASKIEADLISKTEKALKKLEKQESKLKRKLSRKDSTSAAEVFNNTAAQYEVLKAMVERNSAKLTRSSLNNYIPHLDTLKTSLNFLEKQGSDFLSKTGIDQKEIQSALGQLESLDSRIHQASIIKEILKGRRENFREKLLQFGFIKEYKKYSKELYYYSQQVNEYKELLKNPKRIEQKALGLIQKIPAFKEFMEKHSELASLFPQSDFYGSAQGLAGLQARVDVQTLIQNRMQTGGPNPGQIVQQNIQAAQAQLNQLKNKVNELGGGSSDIEMPDFKPNTQKTKSFFQRLELGSNIQNSKANGFLPTTTDLGLSIGYKLNDKSIVGVGVSYKMGWGKDIRRITITHEGVGLRSFLDWKLKGSFYISGGYEYNYRVRFDNGQQLRISPDNWQPSALLGISKKYNIGKKWRGDMKLLFDFLYKQRLPYSQPLNFRFGYTL